MKKSLLLSLLLVCGLVNAEVVAEASNTGGGKIVLTDEICKDYKTGKVYDQLRRSYTYIPSGATTNGCWAIDGETVLFVFDDGDVRRYPVHLFVIKNNKGGNNAPSKGML